MGTQVPPDAPPPPAPSPRQVNYWAVSILTSRMFWVNTASFIVAALSMTEIATVIPSRYATLQAALVALLNIFLRTQTVRPVAFIMPGKTQAVLVPRISPPNPAKFGD